MLRKLEWKYLVCCYGIPLVPALVYLCINTYERGKIYGSAVVRELLHTLTTQTDRA